MVFMVDEKSYLIDGRFVLVRIDLHRRRHEIVISEGKFVLSRFVVSLTQGKGILMFLDGLRGVLSSEVLDSAPRAVVHRKVGRKKKLKGKVCHKCNTRMTKLYMHSSVEEVKQWSPVVWYCSSCDKVRDRIY